jgi:hypothetical protein
MTRKMVDCRSMPSEIGCTLTIAGEEEEFLDAAVAHAVDKHGHGHEDHPRTPRAHPRWSGPGRAGDGLSSVPRPALATGGAATRRTRNSSAVRRLVAARGTGFGLPKRLVGAGDRT